MEQKTIKLPIEYGQKPFSDKDVDNSDQKINLYNLVNEYHYNFHSFRNYKTSCKYKFFSYLCLGISILSMFIFLYASIIDKSLSNLIIYSIISYLLFMIGFFIGVIKNKNLVNRQVFYKFKQYLEKSEKIQYKESRHEFLFFLHNKDLLKNLALRWLDIKINKKNYLFIASEISNASKLLREHNFNNTKPVTGLIYTSDSKVRITSYFIALLSLVSVILISNSDATEFYELFSIEILKLYLKIVFLVMEMFTIVFMFQFIANDILSILKDKFDDLIKQDRVPNKQRINRLVNVLVINHEHEIK